MVGVGITTVTERYVLVQGGHTSSCARRGEWRQRALRGSICVEEKEKEKDKGALGEQGRIC